MINPAEYGCGSGGIRFAKNFEMKAGENNAFEADERTGRFVARYKCLCVDLRAVTKEGWPNQSRVAIQKGSFGGAGQKRRRLEGLECMFCLFASINNSNAIAARGTVSFQNVGK